MPAEHHGKSPTEGKTIEDFTPDTVCIPMGMHLGAPSEPCVEVGQHVKIGQIIGNPVGGLGLPVHASVSGEVVELGDGLYGAPMACPAVVIRNDHQNTWTELTPLGDVETVDPAAIIPQIKNAGICGMGGASFPTHIKLTPPEGCTCDTVIVNGAECETFLTADDRLMREEPHRVVDGLRAVLRAMGVRRGVIAIEDNKPEAIAAMAEAAKNRESVEVVSLPTKYPQGGEKQLIYAVTGREVPSGKLPIEVHAVVLNAGTAAAVADAVIEGKPLVSRITTVTGCVNDPKNLRLPIGSNVADLLRFCGGYREEPGKICLGGGMTGLAIPSEVAPAVKATSGVVVYNVAEGATIPEQPCIRCVRCVTACPMGLRPYQMKAACDRDRMDLAEQWNVMDCIVCGACSYVCPATRWLTPAFKVAKDKITAERKRRGA